MFFQNRHTQKNMMASMFLSSASVMIATQIIGIVAIIVDGIITSRMLGPEAYSAISLIHPFVNIILMFAGFLSVGNQIICSGLVGKGQKKEAGEVLSLSLFLALVLSAIILFFCITMPEYLLGLCGVSLSRHSEYYASMMDYLHGYMFTIPTLLLAQVMGPIIVMDNNKPLFTLSTIALAASDVVLDILNVSMFKGGIFGMGIATSISYAIQFAILLSHFARKNSFFKISLRGLDVKQVIEIGESGLPAFLQRLATTMRNLFISRFNLAIALSVAGVAARGIQDDINNFMFCVSLGLGRAMVTLTGINYSAEDSEGMKKLFSSALKSSVVISGAVGLITFLAAPLIVSIYTQDMDVAYLATFGIRCMSIGLIFDTIATVYQDYLQGIKKRKLVNVLVFCERFFVPVLMALLLGLRFGSEGVLASLAVGKIVLVALIFGIIAFYKKGIPHSLEDVMMLPDDFGGKKENNLYAHIETMEDVMNESKRVEEFCAAHGAESRVAINIGLFLEELASNIVLHGKSSKMSGFGVDYRLLIDDDTITLTLRDLCGYFDPTTWYDTHKENDSGKGLGIKIITGLAKEVRYFNAFNSNNIIVTLDLYKENA